MGWCTGSYMAEDLWKTIEPHLPKEKKMEIAEYIYDLFCDQDADDWSGEPGSLMMLVDPPSDEDL